ncbi:MAG: FAD-binding oxidoreductase [Myxococcota bacterium]
MPETCDLLIVGAGFTGLSCAIHAARRGLNVTLLEAGPIGSGASGRTGGIVLEDTAAGPFPEVSGCISGLERTVKDLAIDCDLRMDGCWELVHRDGSSGAPGWEDEGGRLVADEVVPGGTLEPTSLLAGLARATESAGCCIVENRPVLAVHPGSPAVVEAVGGRIRARHVVLGLNGFTRGLFPGIVELRGALTLALCTEPIDGAALRALGLADRMPFYTTDLPYLWGRTLSDGRLVFGGGLAFDPEDRVTRIGIEQEEAARQLRHLEARVRRLHPALEDFRPASVWGGPVSFRRNRTPVISRLPDRGNVIVTGGYAGHGVALALRIGEIAAEAVAGEVQLPAWGALEASSG